MQADYKNQVGGVVPGYAGHMPRARDKYAGSAHGAIAPERGPPVSKGAQQGHVRPEDVIPPIFESFIASERGVMPGYTGFRPEARHVHNVSAFGGIVDTSGLFGNAKDAHDTGAHDGVFGAATRATNVSELGQGNRTFDWRRNVNQPAPPSFRENVGGVLPGYTGHVPRSTEKHGTSHYGGLAPDKPYVPLAQTGHEGYKIDPMSGAAGEKDVELRMIPNYQGAPIHYSELRGVHLEGGGDALQFAMPWSRSMTATPQACLPPGAYAFPQHMYHLCVNTIYRLHPEGA